MSYGLPYYQLASKWMATDAPIVAALLRVGDAPVTIREIDRMIGLGARLFAYAVDATWSDERPPDGVLLGPDAPALLEAAVQWDGAPGALVAALLTAKVVERLEMGLRVKGMERYKALWEKNSRRNTRNGKTGAQPAGSGPVPSGSGTKPGGTVRETETETETETDEKQQQHLAGASGDPPGTSQIAQSVKLVAQDPTSPGTSNGEQAGQQPPPAEISRPEPTSGTSAADFALSATPQKRGKVKAEDPREARWIEVRDRLVSTFERVKCAHYAYDGAKDTLACKRLARMLTSEFTVDHLDARWAAALVVQFRPACGIADFASRINAFGGGATAPRDVRRGTVRAEDEHHEQGGSIRDF